MTETENSDTIKRSYVYGNYLDEVLMKIETQENTTDDLYYAHDHLFSPVALIESDGDVVERYEYDAYGKWAIYLPDFSGNQINVFQVKREFGSKGLLGAMLYFYMERKRV